MSIYSIAQKKVLFFDDFVAQWGGSYQAHNSGSANRIWSPVSGRDGVLQLQVNSGYNSLRFNPNSLYYDGRKLTVSTDAAIARNSGTQQVYFGLSDKHLGELSITNGVYFLGDTTTNQWRAFSVKSGVTLDSGVAGTLGSNNVFQSLQLTLEGTQAIASVDGVELPLALQVNFAASLMFGIVNSGASWSSFLLDWIEISR